MKKTTIQQCKNKVAQSKGNYLNWDDYENWIVENNQSVGIAQLLVGAMEEATMLYAHNEILYSKELEEKCVERKDKDESEAWGRLKKFCEENMNPIDFVGRDVSVVILDYIAKQKKKKEIIFPTEKEVNEIKNASHRAGALWAIEEIKRLNNIK